uniref:G-protein coupled receptors family 1 profile domain-containing protein n=1 Tax=Cynoglossus semilaevis TaxID=244447 RepID=A0A3P8V2V7_CYNSE
FSLAMEMLESEFCIQDFNNSCKRPSQPYSEAMIIYTVLSSISLVTVVLNLLVIISISHFRQLHTPTNLLMFSLAVADLLVGLLLMPVEIIYVEACWLLGDILCILYYIVDYIITSSSVASMVFISIDRYIAICDPLHYSTKVTKRRAKILVCLSWVCSFLYRSPNVQLNCYGDCIIIVNFAEGAVDFAVTFLGPILIIVILYLRVFVVAVSQARAMRSHVATVALRRSEKVKAEKSEIKAARTLGIVVVVFLICSSPYYVFAIAAESNLVGASSSGIELWLVYCNSSINPVIYVFFYPWFRKAIKHIATLEILKPGSLMSE